MSIGILSERAIEEIDPRLLRINYRFLADEYRKERDHCERVMALNRDMRKEIDTQKELLIDAESRARMWQRKYDFRVSDVEQARMRISVLVFGHRDEL